MWRSLFIGLGCVACILGAEALVLDKAVLRTKAPTTTGVLADPATARREIVPPEWAPWSLLSAGAVTMLYSFTVPNRVKKHLE